MLTLQLGNNGHGVALWELVVEKELERKIVSINKVESMATQEHRSTHNKIVSVQVSSIVTLEALSLQELPPDHSRVALALLIHRDGVVSEIKADDEAAIGILGELAVKRSNVSEECALQPGILTV